MFSLSLSIYQSDERINNFIGFKQSAFVSLFFFLLYFLYFYKHIIYISITYYLLMYILFISVLSLTFPLVYVLWIYFDPLF